MEGNFTFSRVQPGPTAPTPITAAYHNSSLRFGFSGSGFLAFYFTGVAAILQSLGLFNTTTRLSGASGGAITAAAICSDIPAADLLASNFRVASQCRATLGCRGYLESILRPDFDRLLSAAANTTRHSVTNGVTDWCRDSLSVAVTQARPNMTDFPVLLGNFSSKQQLMDAVAASSYLPFFSGRDAVTQYDGVDVYDGQFSYPLPCPSGVPCVKVAASVWAKQNTTGPFGAVSAPGTEAGTLSTLTFMTAAADRQALANATAAGMVPLDPEVLPTPPQPDIYPGLSGPLNITGAQWNSYAYLIPDNATLLYLYNQGRQDAAAWAVSSGLADPSKVQAALLETAAAAA